jgi:NAD(P)H-hydrate epimerase
MPAVLLKPRKRTSHKGQNGRVLVVGGSIDYVGAPTFVGQAALAVLRSGADLVTIAAPERVAWAINCISPDLITRKLPGDWLQPKHLKAVLELAKNADVVVVGNGIGLRAETKAFVQQLVKKLRKPVIIDADALKIVKLQDVRRAVLTPHGGEFGILLKNSKLKGSVGRADWSALASARAGKTIKQLQPLLKDNVLVLKGHPKTLIVSKTKIASNATGHPGMTHGGTGDVLAGIIAGLMAQGNDAFTSCTVAAYVNGAIGERLGKRTGFGYLASDMVKEIPLALKKFQRLV